MFPYSKSGNILSCNNPNYLKKNLKSYFFYVITFKKKMHQFINTSFVSLTTGKCRRPRALKSLNVRGSVAD